MDDQSNPAPPPTPPPGVGTLSYSMPQMDALVFTPRAMDMLAQTKPWARLISVLMWIGAALMLLAGVVGLVSAVAMRGSAGPQMLVLIVYLPMALLYIMPALFLGRYASGIGDLLHLRRADVLEAALEAQKSFWKFVGVMALVIIGIYVVVLIIVVIAAAVR